MSVTVTPSGQLVSTPGGSVRFVCLVFPSDGLMDIQWLVNGTLLSNPTLINATVEILRQGIGALTFANLGSEFNMTRIGCRAAFSDGNYRDSESTLSLLQG